MARDDLQPLVGAWDARFEVVSGPEQVSGEGVDTYRWLTGERVMVHETKGSLGGHPVEAIEIFALDDAGVQSRSVMADGSAADARVRATAETLEIDGETERFRGRFETPDRVVGQWQKRDDGGDWAPWMELTLTRRA